MGGSSLLNRAAHYLANESGRDVEIILFGLRLFLTSISGYIALIIIALLLRILPYVLAAAITASVFRIFSGGAHASSPLRCNLIGVSVFSVFGYLVKMYFHPNYNYTLLISIPIIMFLVGFYIIYRYVPAETPGKPISSQLQRRYLRIISFSLLTVWGIVSLWELSFVVEIIGRKMILSSCLGMAWQLFTLTPLGYRVVGKMDALLKHFT
ncbi:accessory gene regulator B [Thermanaeromonas toyohensis ToBE]|uniref:Accessory gene regulator B n=1 Tax=Thermanaeromonas toyohensis ToBE TaxID=698762 RepID=A0A1W1VZG5_9FIRM|nr:accessory gene regulator B family protein [Thermanaeromonas toyohensis]SMB98663.1 accessory gene regulator B [Thermanaeromonas toyohensis ToBE]